MSGAFGGLIAFGVQNAHVAIANWRLLFIIEVSSLQLVWNARGLMHVLQGIPSFLLGVVAIAFLPNRPEMTSFLNEDERALALERANRFTSSDKGYTVNKSRYLFGFPGVFSHWEISQAIY